MADDQQICPGTHSENNESFFFLRMLRIINHQCVFIIKTVLASSNDTLCFF